MRLFDWNRRTHGKVTVLHRTRWRSLHSIHIPRFGRDYVYLHETYCNGQVVAVLPFRQSVYGWEFLLRREIVPAWDTDTPHLCAITGAAYVTSPEHALNRDLRAVDAVRELHEETGYQIEIQDLMYLGEVRGVKAATTTFTLFTVDLTGREPGQLEPDPGLEEEGDAVWVTINQLVDVTDAQVHAMYVRLLPHLLYKVNH